MTALQIVQGFALYFVVSEPSRVRPGRFQVTSGKNAAESDAAFAQSILLSDNEHGSNDNPVLCPAVERADLLGFHAEGA